MKSVIQSSQQVNITDAKIVVGIVLSIITHVVTL